jgi:hypothetical protein
LKSLKLGLLVRKPRWTLSLRGKLLLLCVVAACIVAGRFGTYPFLALNSPIIADTLIVEGWTPDYMMNEAADEFRRGHYRQLVIVRSVHEPEAEDQRKIDVAAIESMTRMLLLNGVPHESLATVVYPTAERDRTYHTALAAKRWFQEKKASDSFNVATVGPHARRSWLLFRKAFGNTAKMGIVALRDPMYDSKHWWRTSEGVDEIMEESIKYVYVRFFFLWA